MQAVGIVLLAGALVLGGFVRALVLGGFVHVGFIPLRWVSCRAVSLRRLNDVDAVNGMQHE